MSDEALSNLLAVLSAATIDKFSPDFNVHESHYRSSKDKTEINLHVLVPKALASETRKRKCPLLIRIHGGYLRFTSFNPDYYWQITGSSLYPPWFTSWILEYAKQCGAVIVSPNYRLMPEATGVEILEDVEAFWKWIHNGDLETVLSNENYQNLSIDLGRILLVGESAGGYLAMQLALSHPKAVRALVAAYPVLDLHSPFYAKSFSKPIMHVQNRPESLLRDHLEQMRKTRSNQQRVVFEADPPDRLELSFAIVQNGRYLEFLGSDWRLYPTDRIVHHTDADGIQKGRNLPTMFIFHGESDSAVPAEGSRHFVEILNKERPFARVQLELQPGDHGFDFDATLETAWLRNGLKSITDSWLSSTNQS